jgi:hypothetical protein
MKAEFKRLGKYGSYRLGELKAQGIRELARPTMLQPRFNRPDHALPASAWLFGLVLGTIAISLGAYLGSWFLPFVVGLLAGLANQAGGWPLRLALPAVVLMAALGWGAPLGWAAIHGQPYGAVAREAAALAGLPAHASVGLSTTMLIAIVQVVVGYWLGRTLAPHGRRD